MPGERADKPPTKRKTVLRRPPARNVGNEPAGPTRVGDLLGALLAKYGYGDLTIRRDLETAWALACGPRAAKYTRVGSFKRGVLEVLVDNSAMLQELESFEKENLVNELQQRVKSGNVKTIRFRRA